MGWSNESVAIIVVLATFALVSLFYCVDPIQFYEKLGLAILVILALAELLREVKSRLDIVEH